MFVPRQSAANREQLSPEFRKWLRTKNVKLRQVTQQPEVLKKYQKEWLRLSAPKKSRRRILPFSLSEFSLVDIMNHVGKAQQILSVIQNLQTVFPEMTTRRIENKND